MAASITTSIIGSLSAQNEHAFRATWWQTSVCPRVASRISGLSYGWGLDARQARRRGTKNDPDCIDGEMQSGLSDEPFYPGFARYAKPGWPVTDAPEAV